MGILGTIGSLAGNFFGGPTGGVLGGSIGSAFDATNATNSANAFNVQQAQANRDFQERMSSTAWQRGVTDMKAAGLNPMLAYSMGGASSPSGSMAAPAVVRSATALQGAQEQSASQSVAQSQAQTELIAAQTAKTKSETLDQQLNTAALAAQVRNIQTNTTKTEEEVPGVRARSQSDLVKSLVEVSGGQSGYEDTGFYADVRRRKAEAVLSEMAIPAAQQEAKFFKDNPNYEVLSRAMGLINPFSSAFRNFKR